MLTIKECFEAVAAPIKSMLISLRVYADNNLVELEFDEIYPVGSIYINATDGTSPSELFGVGTWEAAGAGRFLLGANDTYPLGSTGGEATHKLTVQELPSHYHSAQGVRYNNNYSFADYANDGTYSGVSTSAAGSSTAHNNMHPYLVVHMWRRTA